jgi:N-acyl-L-homoserine lactone synthetase
MIFPAERIWGIEISGLAGRMPFIPPQIWHLGRLAVDREIVAADPHLAVMRLTLFKTLLVAAFRHICTHEHNLMVAECDTRLNNKIKLMGIHLQVLGAPVNYMGPEVMIPVSCRLFQGFHNSI